MFDTMTTTKVVGAVCGSFLIYLLGGWAAEAIYDPGYSEATGHEQKEIAQAYTIEVPETQGAAAGAGSGGPDFATLYAAADPAKGEKVFAKCRACHSVEGKNMTGPHLDGVVDRAKASVAGFQYSDALHAMASETWMPEKLDAFIANPKKYAPGTKMSFNGLPSAEDRANLIAYLATLK